MKLASNVAMLQLEMWGSLIYPTLMWGGGHLVLFDAGFPGQAEALKEAIRAEGVNPEDLTEIILTHQDIDHIGCVQDMKKTAPRARVLAHYLEAPYISKQKTPLKLAAMLENYANLSDEQKAWCNQMSDAYRMIKIKVDETFEGGEMMEFCGGIEVIHTPGHTPGHMCLYLRESKILVGGDAVNISEDGKLAPPNPRNTPDMEQAMKSFEKIKSLDVKIIVAYHGGDLKIGER